MRKKFRQLDENIKRTSSKLQNDIAELLRNVASSRVKTREAIKRIDTFDAQATSRMNDFENKCNVNTSNIDSVSSRLTSSHDDLANKYEANNVLATKNCDAITKLSNTKASKNLLEKTSRLALENQNDVKTLTNQKATKDLFKQLIDKVSIDIKKLVTAFKELKEKNTKQNAI